MGWSRTSNFRTKTGRTRAARKTMAKPRTQVMSTVRERGLEPIPQIKSAAKSRTPARAVQMTAFNSFHFRRIVIRGRAASIFFFISETIFKTPVLFNLVRPAQKRLHSSDEFPLVEGLGDVIVRPRVQAGYHVLGIAQSGHDENQKTREFLLHLTADIQAEIVREGQV